MSKAGAYCFLPDSNSIKYTEILGKFLTYACKQDACHIIGRSYALLNFDQLGDFHLLYLAHLYNETPCNNIYLFVIYAIDGCLAAGQRSDHRYYAKRRKLQASF